MAAAYFENRIEDVASFELFVRGLPENRSYLLVAGLDQALDYLGNLRFAPEQIDYLRRHPVFARVSPAFFDYLAGLRFTGEVWAMPEGTVAFADEPLLRVTAPIIEAQLLETFLLTTLSFQTSIASKAARVAKAARGRGVVEFGSRRAHGPEAGVLAARAAYIGGCIGTSNVEAGFRYGIPTYGTVAHSFVMRYDEEEASFRDFQGVFPDHAVLLLDTYDTLAAVEKIIRLGLKPAGVRLDSGNLIELSRQVRSRLDAAGLYETKIFASGDLNEYRVAEILAAEAPVDAFGVGTELATSKDAPSLGAIYKLVEVVRQGVPHYRAKFSEDKATYPGSKQVFRFLDRQGLYDHDLVTRAEESAAKGQALLRRVMLDGRRVEPAPPLAEVREAAAANLDRLPHACRQLHERGAYPVRFSPALEKLLDTVRQQMVQPLANPTGKKQ
ncbi:MAG: nicotinate phosphoribosyltransferase [Acidobacteria bacterium]|nr:nicotinate phosphoribosyltransferase [Acidobacteriota bacterium]